MPSTRPSTRRWGAETLRLARAVALTCAVAVSVNLGAAIADPGGHGKHGARASSADTPPAGAAHGASIPAPPASGPAAALAAMQSSGPASAAPAPAGSSHASSPHANERAHGKTEHAQDNLTALIATEAQAPQPTEAQAPQPVANAAPGAGAIPSNQPTPATPTTEAVPAQTPTAPAPSPPSPSPPAVHKPARHPGRARRQQRAAPALITAADAVGGARRAAAARVTAGSSTSAQSVPAPIASGRPARTAEAPPRSRATGHRSSTSSAPPLLRTITRIIGVVPLPIRLAMVVLAALAVGLGASSRLIAVRARRSERQRRQLLEDVGLLQAALLPVVPSRLGPVATSVAYRPADGPAAGGDFYDVFALEDGRVAVILGDLSGHGRTALPHTALVRFTLRTFLEAGLSPRTALQNAAAVLDRQLGESFATVLVATYDPNSRRLVYASAGHASPLILSPRALEALTVCCSPPLGLMPRTGTRQTTVTLAGAAVVCFYTDGLAEARAGTGRVGVAGLERTLSGLGAAAGAEELLEALAAQATACPDDMAACLLHVGGDSAPAAVAVEELELHRDEAPTERARRFLGACGLDHGHIDGFLSANAEALTSAHDVILEVIFGTDGPSPALRRPEVPVLHPPLSRGATRLEVAV